MKMDKKKKVKNAGESDSKVKLEELISRIPEGIDVRETQKGTILRNEKTYLMHVKQSPKGILHFLRTKTGKHLESGYATNKEEFDALIQKIDDKIKSGGEPKSISPSPKIKK